MVWGGIGDVLLASHGIVDLLAQYPYADFQLIVEKRSQAGASFLPNTFAVTPVDTSQGGLKGKAALFVDTLKALHQHRPDLVVSNGTTPAIPLLMRLCGAQTRVGYCTPQGSPPQRVAQHWGLTHRAPVQLDQYAGRLYANVYRDCLFPNLATHSARPLLAEPSEQTQHRLWQLLQENGVTGPFVLIHPGSSTVSRQKGIFKEWAPEQWQSFVALLLKDPLIEGAQVVLAGGPDDVDTVNRILNAVGDTQDATRIVSLLGKTASLSELFALIRAATLFVCVDSSPLQLGVASDTPTVVLFGPTDPQSIIPHDATHVQVVQSPQDLACRPCLWAHRKQCCEDPVCLGFRPHDVWQACRQLLL
jgi:ADP-heptose:LPS heptosyltransferase